MHTGDSGTSRITRVGFFLCLGGAALGVLGLVGWMTGTGLLTTVVPGWPPMMPNTAVALFLVGVGGGLLYREAVARMRRMASSLAAIVALGIGVGTLAEYALGIDLGIDQLLFAAQAAPYPGRPSPPTALALGLLAGALLVFDSHRTARARPAEWLALFA